MYTKVLIKIFNLPILGVTCRFSVQRDEDMGPPPKLDVGERGGLLPAPVRVSTDVIVYVYLSVVTGIQAFIPCVHISGDPQS